MSEKQCTSCKGWFDASSTYFRQTNNKLSTKCITCLDQLKSNRTNQLNRKQPYDEAESQEGYSRGRPRRTALGEIQHNITLLAVVQPAVIQPSPRVLQKQQDKTNRQRINRLRRRNNESPLSTPNPTPTVLLDDPPPACIAVPGLQHLQILIPPQQDTSTPPQPMPSMPIRIGDWNNIREWQANLALLHMETCPRCQEHWFEMKLRDGICSSCLRRDDPKKCTAGMPGLMSLENNMHPAIAPYDLPTLLQMEEMVIARVHIHMSIHRVRGHQYSYRGHCCSFMLDSAKFQSELPSIPAELDIVLLHPSKPSIRSNPRLEVRQQFQRDFRIRRAVVLQWLQYLRANSSAYRGIAISSSNLDALPEDDDVDEEITNIEEDEHPDAAAESAPVNMDGDDPGEPYPSSHPVLSFVPNTEVQSAQSQLLIQELSQRILERRKGNRPDRPHIGAPHINTTPLDEIGRTHNLFAMAFPSLFPDGNADWHDGRVREVGLKDWIQHMLKYKDGRFAQHPRFRFFAHDLLMRSQARKTSSFYISRNSELKSLSLEELKERLEESPVLLDSVVRVGKNLTGTRPYWNSKRVELIAYARNLTNMGASFLTFSCADHQWDDLQRHLPRFDEWQNGDERQRSNIAWENVQNNPHIIAQWLHIRFKAFLETVVKPYLKMDDYWLRYEWQVRGTGHIHMILWTKGEPHMGKPTEERRRDIARFWAGKISAWNPNIQRPADDRNPASLPFTRIINTDDTLSALLHRLQMHRQCAPGRCMVRNKDTAEDECRFYYPRELQEVAEVNKHVDKRTWRFAPRRNMGLINACSPTRLMGWIANCDIQPVISIRALINYCCKYVGKAEKESASFATIQAEVSLFI
jgi:hypothetical protein